MFRSFLALSFLSTALLAIGCGDDTTNTTSGGPTISAADACAALGKAVCAKIQSCSPLIYESNYADTADCEAREALRCSSVFEAEGSNSTPSDTKGCADAFGSTTCDDLFSGNLPAACEPTPGTLANGAPCGREVQCASTQCVTKGELCGVCAEPIQAGGACTAGEECERGLACINSACTALGTEGSSCTAAPCTSTLACVNGMCVKPVAAGAACMKMNGVDNCDKLQGLYCNAMNVCQQVKLVAAGQPCGFLNMEIVGCASNGFCRVPMGMMSGTCIAPAADGAACDQMQGPKCLPGALCVNNVCALNDTTTCN